MTRLTDRQLEQIRDRTRAGLNRQTTKLEEEHARDLTEAAASRRRPALYSVTQQTSTYSPGRKAWRRRDELVATGLTHAQALRCYPAFGFAGVKLHEEREWAVFDKDSDDLLAGPFDDHDDCETALRELIAHGHHARHLTIGAIL